MNGDNIDPNPVEANFIRSLSDFDLTMFLSELNDHGWLVAKVLMKPMAEGISKQRHGESDAAVEVAKNLLASRKVPVT